MATRRPPSSGEERTCETMMPENEKMPDAPERAHQAQLQIPLSLTTLCPLPPLLLGDHSLSPEESDHLARALAITVNGHLPRHL